MSQERYDNNVNWYDFLSHLTGNVFDFGPFFQDLIWFCLFLLYFICLSSILQDFTTGINCETCLPGYYRPYGVPHTSNQPCRKCQCRESVGSTGICVEDDSRVDAGLVCIFYSWVLNSAGYLLQLGFKFSRISFTVGY